MSWAPRPAADKYRIQVATALDFTNAANLVENTTTQTTAYAPLLTQTKYVNGGSFYWRVAMVDADFNTGDYTAPQPFSLPKLLRLSSFGYPVKGRYRTITITARQGNGAAVRSARICLWGAGISVRCKLTGSVGETSFYVKATRYGRVYVKGTKTGYRTASLTLRVR